MENVEFDKHYVLRSDNYYWCIPIQRRVLFDGPVVVVAKQKSANGVFNEPLWFGKLMDTGGMVDFETNVEIEFGQEDVVREYNLKKGFINYFDLLVWNP